MMSSMSLSDLMGELESLAGWADEMRSSFGTMNPGTVLVAETQTWRENPPIIRPPRTTLCIRCIEETKTTVTAGDLFQALTNMKDWLTSLKVDVGGMRGNA